MKNLLLGLILFFTLNAYAQNTHTVNFEALGSGANWDWSIEENGTNPPLEFIANPVSGGINSSPTVAKFIAKQDGQPWALCYTDDDGEFTFDATNSTVKIFVYKELISNVGIKFEGLSPASEIQIPNTLTNQWEELTFDFSAFEGNTYSRLVIIPDFEARTEDHIIYFDNIQVPNGVPVAPLPEPTTAPPIPSHEQVDVLSIYSEEYTNLPGTNFNPNWGQTTIVTLDYNAVGNNTLKYENLNYQGTQFTNQDVSAYEFLHVDFWTPNSTALNFYLISPGNEIAFPLTITPETWVSVDIPLSAFVPPVNLSDVFQFKVDGNGTVYFDNWYFWKDPINPGSDATLSDLQVDGSTVAGFSTTTLNYDVELPLGTLTVPTVDATTNDPAATFVVNPTSSLPGTTEVIVTAQNGTTMLTYTVNFTIASPEPTTAPPVPTQLETDVLSIYSDAYNNLPGVNYNPAWGQQTIVTVDYNIAGNNTIMYENLNYQGTEFVPQDVSEFDFIHLDFWTSNATELGFYLISQGPLEKEYTLTIEPETWVSVDIPLSYFAPPISLSDVFQFKVTGNGDVWFDNWYFWKNPTNPEGDATLSDLLVDGTTVEGFSPSVLSYAVELPFGSTEVPTVTATTTYFGATLVINNAATLPGTTNVVVTSQDETNTLTYSIDFTVGPETPLSAYCETEVWHFMNPAELPSAILLTITNVDASSMIVEIESANDDPVNYLLVLGGSGATISPEDTLVPGKISRTLTWTEAPPEDVLLNLLWSKDSFGGNWQLSQTDISVPFAAICGPVVPTVSFNPNDGAIDVLVTVQPTLTFSVPVEMADGSEITNADIPSFVSLNQDDALGQAVPYAASINTGKTLITIVPKSDLENGQTYYFAIADQMIKYLDGELLEGQSVTFTTEAGPKPYLELDVQDNFEDDGWATIDGWMYQDPDLIDLTITEDPVNATNHVADYNRSGTFLYTNAQVILDHRMDLTERHIFTLKAYFPSTNDYSGDLTKTAAIKLQNSLLGEFAYTSQTEVVKTVNVLNAWVTLTFDFAAAADSVNYDQIVVQLGGENHLVPAQLYFDNLLLKEIQTGPQADFTATPVSGYAPLAVQFTDMSSFNASSWQWDFDNDGTVDSNVKNPSYIYVNPGTYSVKLVASNPFIGTAELIKVDYISVAQAPHQQVIQIPIGWSSISSYVIPENTNIENLFGSIADDIEIMVGDGGVYYPSQGINTIIDWNSHSGYVIKMAESAEVTFNGQEAASNTITVSAGWSLIPVTISCDVNVAELFGAFPQVIAIREVAGLAMYWPEKGINTLIKLSSGKAYYILTNDELTFNYRACLEGYDLIWSDEFNESDVNTDN